jgi:predicted dehydrogenase
MSNLRAALIGLGAMGKNHARVLRALPGVDLVAVFDPAADPSTSDLPIVSNLQEIINLKPDYCVIATPTFTHEEIATKLANEGINVFIEKPISSSSESANRIIEVINDNKLIGGVGHIERFNAAYIEAKRRLLLNDLGEIYQISTRRLGPFPARITDVGVTIDLATHDVDVTKWLADSRYKRLSAQSAKRMGGSHEDLISCVGMLENGVLVSHNVNWVSPLKERKTIVTGEKGTFVIDSLRSDLTYYENGSILNTQREIAHFKGVTQGQVTSFAFDKPEALMTEHLEFIKALRGEETSYVSLQDALDTLRIAEGIIESFESGETISL